jgi:hypothetical protein
MARLFFTWDDGHPDDFLLKGLHEKYAFPCMLFVPVQNREGKAVLSSENLVTIESDIVEIGSHTYHHTYLTELAEQDVYKELIDGKNYLEDVLGHSIEHFCYPGGRYNAKIERQALGIYKTVRQANTMCVSHRFPIVDTTFHFYPRGWRSIFYNSFRQGSGGLLLSAAGRFLRESYFEFIKHYIYQAFNRNSNDDIVIFGHSWELSEFHLWEELEHLFSFIKTSGISAEKYSLIC